VSAPTLEALIEASDLDGLVVAVDRRCDGGDWDGVVSLGERCRRALERGRQLWPVVSYAEYRLALSAPAPYAGAVVVPGAGRFALGPLPEVAAAGHQWSDLAPFLAEAGPLGAVCAHERVVRGEDLTGWATIDRAVLEIPLRLEPWEPEYPAAQYEPAKADFPAPRLPSPSEAVEVRPGSPAAEEVEGVRSLLELASAWTTESDGRAEAVAVHGDVSCALGALGVPSGRARVSPLPAASALALMAWTAASGGAHGRRRGMAAGRFGAWWALAALGGVLDDWPVDGSVLGDVCASLQWWLWDAGEPSTGWSCRLAVEDPADSLAWALAATDSA
jgi:Family of unknown function (DUF6183)